MVNDKLAINGGEAVFKHEVKERWNNIISSDIRKVSKYLKNGDLSIIDGGVMK